MQVRGSNFAPSRQGAADLSARQGHLYGNPAVQPRLYNTDQARREAKTKLRAKYARHRNQAVWAQALVLFNVVGIPLSQGVYLEYYFNVALPGNSLTALSIIPALQIACTCSMPILMGRLYHWRGQRSGWRSMFLAAATLALGAQLPLQWAKSYVVTMLLQGPILGAALGTLFSLSTLVLSSHYRSNLPLVSMQSGSMAFFGAIVYTLVVRQGLQTRGLGHFAPAATACILAVTLLVALLLLHRVQQDERPADPHAKLTESNAKMGKEKVSIWFVSGYAFIFMAIFVFPMYITLSLTSLSTHLDPDTASLVPITLLSTAAISACISANPFFRARLGPINTFIASTLLASAAILVPFFMPMLYAAVPCSSIYGIGLAGIIVLHIKVSSMFSSGAVLYHPHMPVRVALMMILAGCSAATGLLASAVLLEYMENGAKIAASGAAACLVLGACLIAVARWRRCRKFWVAI